MRSSEVNRPARISGVVARYPIARVRSRVMVSLWSRSVRPALGRWRRDLSWVWELRGSKPSVIVFTWRALRVARRTNDAFSLISVTRPRDVENILRLARGRDRVVELGTGTGWTTIALALDNPRRHVLSFDVQKRSVDRYARLVSEDVQRRITFVVAPGSAGSRSGMQRHDLVDFLYVDSSHERDETIAEWRVWQPQLAPDAVVVFDDYESRDYPGVREAIEVLGLQGEPHGKLYVYRNGVN